MLTKEAAIGLIRSLRVRKREETDTDFNLRTNRALYSLFSSPFSFWSIVSFFGIVPFTRKSYVRSKNLSRFVKAGLISNVDQAREFLEAVDGLIFRIDIGYYFKVIVHADGVTEAITFIDDFSCTPVYN